MSYQTAFENMDCAMYVHDFENTYGRRKFRIKYEGKTSEYSVDLTLSEMHQLREALDFILRPYDQPAEEVL